MTTVAAPVAQAAAMPVPQLRRVRWAVRATLVLGVAASVAANILHARPNPISQVIAAWPPLALLLTVELISRVPVHRRSLGIVRLAATTAIAGIAAWVSYWHMAGVAAHYGETGPSPYLLPLSVDGLVIVASVSLVELAGRIRIAARHDINASAPTCEADAAANPPLTTLVGASRATRVGASRSVPRVERPADTNVNDSVPDEGKQGEPVRTGLRQRPEGSDGDPLSSPSFQDGAEGACESESPDDDTSAKDETVPSDTAAAVAYWHRRDPNLHPAQIGAKIGRSERTVRRYWPPAATYNEAARSLVGIARSRRQP